ncbi:Histone-lysine N-methyltransferase, H3 lysine-79 specific [Eumeta japonica]|uniref:Histone-lysine N-methyltransferase, H3 lysine-79 specific n=1 Tax=Eumeta variegata TaxID=151549 RepID=A0A4C2ADI3_EUMVA|nr:Histone-lysine N-methyltransferase, H3 lysine-79 specific [Eumeta japonica]
MNELGINVSSPNDLIAKAKELWGATKSYRRLYAVNGKSKLHDLSQCNDLSEASAHELVLKEIANTLSQRKKLVAQFYYLLSANNNIVNNAATQPSITVTKTSGKTVRRGRDHRTRSQEWPDVPDVGKIEESNPEVLAQKILETGRKIEAGKLTSNLHANSSKQQQQQHQNMLNNHHHHHQQLQQQQQQQQHQHHLVNQNPHHLQQQQQQQQLHPEDKPYRNNKHHPTNHHSHQHHLQHQRSNSSEHLPSLVAGYGGIQQDPSALMPAPKQRDNNNLLNAGSSTRPVNNSNALTSGGCILPKCDLPGMRKPNNNNVPIVNIQESPKVANFEDRLKSIITSALNEDQEQRKAQQVVNQVQVEVSPSPQQSPIPKRSKHSHANQPNSNFHAGSLNTHNSLSSIINVATHGMTILMLPPLYHL